MKRGVKLGALTVGLALAVAGLAWAAPQQGFGNPDEITKDVSSLGDLGDSTSKWGERARAGGQGKRSRGRGGGRFI